MKSSYFSPTTSKKYLIVKQLDKGQFGKVFLGKDENNVEMAMKFVPKEKIKYPNIFQLFKNEVQIMQSLKHPRLLQLIDYIEDQKYIILVTQYCEGGNLEEYLSRYQKQN